MRRTLRAPILALLALVLPLLGTAVVPAAEGAPPPDLKVGKRIYREGIRASGQPVTVIVAGDTHFEGRQFNCQSCHRRSGLGSFEGDVVASLVTAEALYSDKTAGPRKRGPYTEQSLVRALREGIDPEGQPFDPIMPRYELNDAEMAGLIAYMRTLSAEASPGVSDAWIHFATVVAGDVDPGPMLDVLQTFVEEKNNQRRNPRGRKRAGPFYRAKEDQAYRQWKLHVWRLAGPPESWREQLETLYAEQPVFALVSGMADGSWRPIHEFCEKREIPCFLPNTDLPVVDGGDDYYTLYFSEGLTLEARTIAEHLESLPGGLDVLQVVHGDERSVTGAEALREALRSRRDDVETVDIAGRPQDASDRDVIVLWLTPEEIASSGDWIARTAAGPSPPRIYLSSTTAGGSPATLPEVVRRSAWIAHPYTLDEEFPTRFARARVWLESRKLPVREPRIQAQTYFACMLLGESLMHVKYDFYYREFVIESTDHMTVLPKFSIAHPTPSFGPGQRFISKGCYMIAPLGRQDVEAAAWIVPGH